MLLCRRGRKPLSQPIMANFTDAYVYELASTVSKAGNWYVFMSTRLKMMCTVNYTTFVKM